MSVFIFVVGFAFMVYVHSSVLDETCSGFSITAQVTQPAVECSGLFADMVFGSTIWLALWAVLCFFIFLIVIEHILPKLEKKKKRKGRS